MSWMPLRVPPLWWASHTRGLCAPAWAARPPPGTCRADCRGVPRLDARPEAQAWRVAKAMRLLAWTQPRARGCMRGDRASGANAPRTAWLLRPMVPRGARRDATPHRARGPARVGPQSARGAGQRPYDGRSRRSVQRQTTRGAEPARWTAVPPWPSPVSRVRRSTPCPPRTAGRLLLCSSMQGIIPLA